MDATFRTTAHHAVAGSSMGAVPALHQNGVPVTTEFHHGTHPGPVEVNRYYDFDALRAFLPQAMTAMGTTP